MALRRPAVESGAIPGVEVRARGNAVYEVGIGEEGPPKGDGIGMAFANRAFGERGIISARRDHRAGPERPAEFAGPTRIGRPTCGFWAVGGGAHDPVSGRASVRGRVGQDV